MCYVSFIDVLWICRTSGKRCTRLMCSWELLDAAGMAIKLVFERRDERSCSPWNMFSETVKKQKKKVFVRFFLCVYGR